MLNRYLTTPDLRKEWKLTSYTPLRSTPSAYLRQNVDKGADLKLPPLSDFDSPRPSSLQRIDERRRKGLSTPGNPCFDSSPSSRRGTRVGASTPNLGHRDRKRSRLSLRSVKGMATPPDIWEQEGRDAVSEVHLGGRKGIEGMPPKSRPSLIKQFLLSRKDRLTSNFASDPLIHTDPIAQNYHSYPANFLERRKRFSSVYSGPASDRPSSFRSWPPETEMVEDVDDDSPSIEPQNSKTVSNYKNGFPNVISKVSPVSLKKNLDRVHERNASMPSIASEEVPYARQRPEGERDQAEKVHDVGQEDGVIVLSSQLVPILAEEVYLSDIEPKVYKESPKKALERVVEREASLSLTSSTEIPHKVQRPEEEEEQSEEVVLTSPKLVWELPMPSQNEDGDRTITNLALVNKAQLASPPLKPPSSSPDLPSSSPLLSSPLSKKPAPSISTGYSVLQHRVVARKHLHKATKNNKRALNFPSIGTARHRQIMAPLDDKVAFLFGEEALTEGALSLRIDTCAPERDSLLLLPAAFTAQTPLRPEAPATVLLRATPISSLPAILNPSLPASHPDPGLGFSRIFTLLHVIATCAALTYAISHLFG